MEKKEINVSNYNYFVDIISKRMSKDWREVLKLQNDDLSKLQAQDEALGDITADIDKVIII